jgi:hypothetical protein
LNGRWFSARKVVAESYDEARYLQQDYTGELLRRNKEESVSSPKLSSHENP